MIVWINGPYGVGKSTLAQALHIRCPHSFVFDAEAVGNAVRDNMPREIFYSAIFEDYPLWFELCTRLLGELTLTFDGDLYVPMTLICPDSFDRMACPLRAQGVDVLHILLESSRPVIRERILARGETEDCWCMQNIDRCLESQKDFRNVIRVASYGKSVDALAGELLSRIHSASSAATVGTT